MSESRCELPACVEVIFCLHSVANRQAALRSEMEALIKKIAELQDEIRVGGSWCKGDVGRPRPGRQLATCSQL